jgi:hypothetical protein
LDKHATDRDHVAHAFGCQMQTADSALGGVTFGAQVLVRRSSGSGGLVAFCDLTERCM